MTRKAKKARYEPARPLPSNASEEQSAWLARKTFARHATEPRNLLEPPIEVNEVNEDDILESYDLGSEP